MDVPGEVTLYGDGSSWETERLRHHLDLLGIPYSFVPQLTEEDERAVARGERATPRVHVSNGRKTRLLGAPNETALDGVLRSYGLLPAA
jgi:hypothetical protein